MLDAAPTCIKVPCPMILAVYYISIYMKVAAVTTHFRSTSSYVNVHRIHIPSVDPEVLFKDRLLNTFQVFQVMALLL